MYRTEYEANMYAFTCARRAAARPAQPGGALMLAGLGLGAVALCVVGIAVLRIAMLV